MIILLGISHDDKPFVGFYCGSLLAPWDLLVMLCQAGQGFLDVVCCVAAMEREEKILRNHEVWVIVWRILFQGVR